MGSDERVDCRMPRFRRADSIGAESEWGEIEHDAARPTHAFDDGVVPHPTAVQEAGSNKEGRRDAMGAEQWHSDFRIVRVTVVEGDACWPGGQAASLQPRDPGRNS